MTWCALIFRSLRFHARAHLGVVLGAAVGSAALIGALIVGDSVRGSLREMALQRLGEIYFVLDGKDRLFSNRLAQQVRIDCITHASPHVRVVPVLKLAGTTANADASLRANQVQVFGVENDFADFARNSIFSNLPPDAVVLNEPLAAALKVASGDSVVLRVRKAGALNADSPIAPQDHSTFALRLHVHAVAEAERLGNLNLTASQLPPFNAFVSLGVLQENAQTPARANLLLAGRGTESSYWVTPGTKDWLSDLS